MNNIKHFYADPEGNVRDNDMIMSLDILRQRHGNDGIILRFALEPDANKMYIQDPSTRKRMSDGDKDIWHFVNQCLKYAKACHGVNFPVREYGNPKGCPVKKRMADYGEAWQELVDFLPLDANVDANNILVVEHYDPDGESPPIFMHKGGAIHGEAMDEPFMAIERHGLLGRDVDSSHSHLSDLAQTFYLRNMPFMHDGINDQVPEDYMVAMERDGQFGIFKVRNYEEIGRETNGKHLVFAYVPEEKRLTLRGHTSLETYRDDYLSDLLKKSLKTISRASGTPAKDIIVDFDHSMDSPYLTKTSRYRALHVLLDGKLEELPVLELPMDIENGAAMVKSIDDEKSSMPDLLKHRILKGLEVDHPYMAVSSKGRRGRRYRNMARLLSDKTEDDSLQADLDFSVDPDTEGKIRFLLEMGMRPRDIIDMMAGDSMPRRMRHAKSANRVLRDLFRERHRQAFLQPTKTAAIGPTYDVNSWWHIGLQEDLNESQHTENPDMANVEPINTKKQKEKGKKQKYKPYEALLDRNRDKNFGYLKSTEQLLRENRI